VSHENGFSTITRASAIEQVSPAHPLESLLLYIGRQPQWVSMSTNPTTPLVNRSASGEPVPKDGLRAVVLDVTVAKTSALVRKARFGAIWSSEGISQFDFCGHLKFTL
jgi:hypothetical protein